MWAKRRAYLFPERVHNDRRKSARPCGDGGVSRSSETCRYVRKTGTGELGPSVRTRAFVWAFRNGFSTEFTVADGAAQLKAVFEDIEKDEDTSTFGPLPA